MKKIITGSGHVITGDRCDKCGETKRNCLLSKDKCKGVKKKPDKNKDTKMTNEETDLLLRYLSYLIKMKRSKNTIRTKKATLNAFEEWLASQKPRKALKSCVNGDVMDYLNSRGDLSTTSRRQALIEIKSFFKWCKTQAKVDIPVKTNKDIFRRQDETDRCEGIMELKVPGGDKFTALSGGEVKDSITLEDAKFLVENSKVAYHDKIIILLLMYFGLRREEFINNVVEGNVNFRTHTLKITKSKTQAGIRILYFDAYIASMLKLYLNNKFTFIEQLNRMFWKYEGLVESKNNPHAFRGLFITRMRNSFAGCTEYAPELTGVLLKTFFGHARTNVTDKSYTKIPQKEIEELWVKYHYLTGYKPIQLPKK